MNLISEKHLKWWTQDQTCNLLTSIPNLMAEKVTEISLIVLLASASILPQVHFIINNFVLASFMSQLTSIVSKNKIIEIKKDNNIQCSQSYYESPRRSDLKILRNSIIFICTYVYTKLIKNIPHISFLMSFICKSTITGYQQPTQVQS